MSKGTRAIKFSILASTLFLVAGVGVAAELSFEEAKANADQIEESLAADTSTRLVEAQGRLANSAFPYCFNKTQTPPPNFTVVVEMDAEGRVARSWVDQGTAWGLCFRERMVKDFSFTPESQPFFTSFEYKNAP